MRTVSEDKHVWVPCVEWRCFTSLPPIDCVEMLHYPQLIVHVAPYIGVKYGSRNVLADAAVREGIKKFSNWPTIPQVRPRTRRARLIIQAGLVRSDSSDSNLQIFVKGEFIGGADILMSMHENGDLEKLLDPVRKAQQKA